MTWQLHQYISSCCSLFECFVMPAMLYYYYIMSSSIFAMKNKNWFYFRNVLKYKCEIEILILKFLRKYFALVRINLWSIRPNIQIVLIKNSANDFYIIFANKTFDYNLAEYETTEGWVPTPRNLNPFISTVICCGEKQRFPALNVY